MSAYFCYQYPLANQPSGFLVVPTRKLPEFRVAVTGPPDFRCRPL